MCGTRVDGIYDGLYTLFRLDSGEWWKSTPLSDNRVLSSYENYHLGPAGDVPETGVQWLDGYRYATREWRIEAGEITELTGHPFTPTTGWRSFRTETDGTIVQYLGPNP